MRLDSFELSKIAGAILCTLLVIVGFRVALEISEHGKAPEKPGYVLPMPEEAGAQGKGEAAPAGAPAAPAFDAAAVAQAAAAGNVEAGAVVFKKCVACHSIEPGGPNKVGPNLAGVVDRAKASHAGFAYSDALKAKGGNWSFADLAAFIHNPKGFVPGTKMLFPGIADTGDLADLLAYLNSVK
jgi:cytochrome c